MPKVTISVLNRLGNPIAGVSISGSDGLGTQVTDADGIAIFNIDAPETYLFAPSMAGVDFAPVDREVAVNVADRNIGFVALESRYTYDPSSTDAQVLLLTDIRMRVPDVRVEDPKKCFLSDAEYLRFYQHEGSVLRTAAAALEMIAGSEVLILKAISILDLKTNAVASGEFLVKKAERLRAQDNTDDAEDEEEDFDVAEFSSNWGYGQL